MFHQGVKSDEKLLPQIKNIMKSQGVDIEAETAKYKQAYIEQFKRDWYQINPDAESRMGSDIAADQAYLYAERKYKAEAEEEVAARYFGTVAAELGLGNIVGESTVNRITSKVKGAVGVADNSRNLSRRILSAVAKYNRVQNAKSKKAKTDTKKKNASDTETTKKMTQQKSANDTTTDESTNSQTSEKKSDTKTPKKSNGKTADAVYEKGKMLKVGDKVGEVKLVADESGAPVTPVLRASFDRTDVPSYILATVEATGDTALIAELEQETAYMMMGDLTGERAQLPLHDAVEELSEHVRDGNITPEQAAHILSSELANPTNADIDTLVDRENLSAVKYMVGDSVRYDQTMNKTIELYTEKQYNNFGWASYNDVITSKERETLFSLYADHKKNRHKYPITRFGEAVISSSTEAIGVIMYAKGPLECPQITKIVRVESPFEEEIFEIQEEINKNERAHNLQPYETIESFYSTAILTISKARDYASFQEYRSESKRESSENAYSNSRGIRNGRDGIAEYQEGDTELSDESVNQDISNYHYSIALPDSDTATDAIESGNGEYTPSPDADYFTIPLVDCKQQARFYKSLAQALYKNAKTNYEREVLSRFRDNAEKVAEEYAKLDSVNSELQKMMYAKGKRDELYYTRMNELKDTKDKINQRLNEYEKDIRSVKAAQPIRDMIRRSTAIARKAEHTTAQEKVNKIRSGYLEKQKARTQSRKNTETRNKIKRLIQKLRSLSEHPTKERNVKIDMQEFASTALQLADVIFGGATNAEIARMELDRLSVLSVWG